PPFGGRSAYVGLVNVFHESEPGISLGVWKNALAACKALAQLRLAMDESTFLFTSESVSEGHPGIPYND
ncbi:MAG: S-adenosylmethionine synthetase N-terminal domain-containing protein, partial [Pirellulales bacterium]|nr:S-adenosylmethionine synthetase N-terminal domain-containing protein [Pirellulales bacterium]